MSDMTQRDLSRIPEHKLSPEERRELQRRYDEFLGILRRKSGILPSARPQEKVIRPWTPTKIAKSS